MSNTLSFDELLAKATQLGSVHGAGKDTQIKFLLAATEGGYLNVLDLTSNKHGTDIDDATKLSEAYVKGQNSAAVFDAKAPNQRKLISTVRTGIKLGAWPKGGQGEPMATVHEWVAIRQKLRANPLEAKKLDDAANGFLRFARAQLKRDTLISGEELKSFCYKPTKDLSTVEELIKTMTKQLDKLIDGTASEGTAQDASQLVLDARQSLRDRLSEISKAKTPGYVPPLLAVV